MDETARYMDMLDEAERTRFRREFALRCRHRRTAVMLTFLLGGWGVHRFYLGHFGFGAFYCVGTAAFAISGIEIVAFCLIFIVIADLFLTTKRVESYNNQVAKEIYAKLWLLR